MIVRKLAIVETTVLDKQPYQQQMFLLSEQEFEQVKHEFPNLTVRWAEQEDRKKWAVSPKLFDDPRGVPTRSMLVLPDEVMDRMRRAKKEKRL